MHWPDPNTPFHETAEALLRCQEAGKIQNIGLSNFPLSKIQEISQDFKIYAVQVQYNLIDTGIEEKFEVVIEENLQIEIITVITIFIQNRVIEIHLQHHLLTQGEEELHLDVVETNNYSFKCIA